MEPEFATSQADEPQKAGGHRAQDASNGEPRPRRSAQGSGPTRRMLQGGLLLISTAALGFGAARGDGPLAPAAVKLTRAGATRRLRCHADERAGRAAGALSDTL